MGVFAYILAADSGFAPNPFQGWCTLACCKPAIRRRAQPGDWIMGITPHALGNELAYAFRVNESLTFAEYWQLARTSSPGLLGRGLGQAHHSVSQVWTSGANSIPRVYIPDATGGTYRCPCAGEIPNGSS